MGTAVETGGKITLMTMNGTFSNKTVIGISQLFGYSGVFQFEDYAAEDFGAKEKTLHLIKLEGGADKREVSNEMRKSLVTYGFYAIVIEEVIEQFLEVQNAFFDLFNAFLALGLIIGIVGLGIVTLRSVYERRHEIGMMRAVGFKRRAVVGSFIGESGFIAGSGLMVGTGLGIILGWVLWRDGLEESLPEFGIPWVRLLIIVGIALMFAILASIPPSYRASRISPADALRYE
jgi:putative ABC transport system permease protein